MGRGMSLTLWMLQLVVTLLASSVVVAVDGLAVVVETLNKGSGPPVTKAFRYESMVTLYMEEDDGSKTPSGWSTRKSDGAVVDAPFAFQPGVNLIAGWSEGVVQMNEGERALIHIPSHLGYGDRPMGHLGGSFYIPANSNLLFDIEILGKEGAQSSEF
eukprot:scaffold150856_cov54-Attheya_sp.AAC.1